MRRLTPFTLAWRNFLYANPDGYQNDPKELYARVTLIQNEREAILDQMLKNEPDMNEIQMSKEEIAFQIENLEDMAKEFAQYVERYHFYPTSEEVQSTVLDDFRKNGTESELYIVAEEWQEFAGSADKIMQEFEEKFEYACDTEAREYLLQQMMDLQMSPKARENHQMVKEELDKFEQSQSICRNKTSKSIIQSQDGIPPADSKDGLTEPAMTAAQPSRSARKIPSPRRI